MSGVSLRFSIMEHEAEIRQHLLPKTMGDLWMPICSQAICISFNAG